MNMKMSTCGAVEDLCHRLIVSSSRHLMEKYSKQLSKAEAVVARALDPIYGSLGTL